MGVDPEAIEAYEKHAADLLRYATSLVGPAHAEDVVSDAMLRVFRSAKWKEVRDARGYLFRCILNEARRFDRSTRSRQRREAFAGAAWARAACLPTAGDELGALAQLSVRERSTVYLAYWEDLTPAMIADRLDISEGAVRRYLARARAKLREVL